MFKTGVFILSSLLVTSCTHTKAPVNSRTFKAPREKVWEVLVAVFKSYPLKTIDEQKGYIETAELKADRFWKAPYQRKRDFLGYSYVITVNLSYRKPIARVFIDKKVYKQKGFISTKEEVPSDFLEETVLLYRIAKELSIRSRLDQL